MRRRLGHPLVIVGTIEAVLVIVLATLAAQPSWRLDPFSFGGSTPSLTSLRWNPGGTAVIAAGTDMWDVLRPDGSALVSAKGGTWPVWVDDASVVAFEHAPQDTRQLVRVTVPNGSRQLLGSPHPPGRLYADGQGHLAMEVVGERAVSLVNARDGTVLDTTGNARVREWTSSGTLILVESLPGVELQNRFPDGGFLTAWVPGENPRRIAPDLVDLHGSAVASPAGDIVACFCSSVSDPEAWPWLWLVPVDGSRPERLAPWRDQPWRAGSAIAWLADGSLVVVDTRTVARVGRDAVARPLLDLEPEGIHPLQEIGRIYRVGDAFAITRGPDPTTRSASLLLADRWGHVILRSAMYGLNTPWLAVHPTGKSAIVVGDPLPDRVRNQLFQLSLR